MNTQIPTCLITQAAKNEGQARAILQDACKAALSLGAFTITPCTHTPKCRNPSETEIGDLRRNIPEFKKLATAAMTWRSRWGQGRN